jgi:SynChlorMet cassette protein ScmD
MDKMPLRNPDIVFREEFDEWGVLFDPETGKAVAMDPVAVFYWKHLDGSNDKARLLEMLKKECEDVPDDADQHLDEFLGKLREAGFISL